MALLAIGLVMVGSASASPAGPLLGPGVLQTAFGRQVVFVTVGVAVMLVTARLAPVLLVSEKVRRGIGQVLFALALACLLAALVPSLADAHRGSQRWLRLGPSYVGLSFQPSEVTKVALVAFLASLLGSSAADPRSFWRGFMPAAAGIGACVLLVGKEDFGTASLLACVGGLTLLVAGCRFRHLITLVLVGAAAMSALLWMAPYRLERLATYRHYWDDPLGAGYQPVQSLTAIASGGWLGTGLGAGVQKYGYLPDCRTDFIYSVICEESGLLGGVLVIALFCALVWLGLRVMGAARTRFERLLAFGLTATIGLQAAMHVAVVTVVTPTTGISLPLVSAGGSGVITFCWLVGLLSAVATRGRSVDPVGDAGGADLLYAGNAAVGGEAAAW